MASLVALTACQSSVKKVAMAKSIDSVYDAGLVKADSFKHTFYIKSTGTADLVVDTIVSSCECTVANWQRGPVKPGDSAYVNVTIKPNKDELGKAVVKNVMARTNAVAPLSSFTIVYQR